MKPTSTEIPDYNSIIDKYYLAGSSLRDIYLCHCQSVAELALEIAAKKQLTVDREEIIAAAMLHDIGVFLTDAPSIHCTGTEPYLRHGILGAELLRSEGVDEKYARVAELHTGSGLTATEIIAAQMPLEPRDYLPSTLLERLICYADKFYSKSGSMKRKEYERVRKSMARFGEEPLKRFDELHAQFS